MARGKKKGNYMSVTKYIGNKGGMSSVASGAAMGAMIGAAIGAAGVYAFVDTNRRKMLTERMYSIKDYAAEAVNGIQKNGMAMNMATQANKGRKHGKAKKKAGSKKK